MSDPAHPVQTDTLTEPPMLSPHESLNLNPKRGLLAAVIGNPSTYPGLVSIYDVRKDCRHPVLQSTAPVARLGHESGFSPDGKTFYAAGTAFKAITAIDVTDPKNPHAIWQGNVISHGMSLSDDGNRAYIADPDGEHADPRHERDPGAQARPAGARDQPPDLERGLDPAERDPVHRATASPTCSSSTSTRRARPAAATRDAVGAGADHRHLRRARSRASSPTCACRSTSPTDHAAASSDPGAGSPVQGYAAHYCNLPTRRSTRRSSPARSSPPGLRVFDISDLPHPKEIAYFVAPTQPRAENGFMASDFAMSQPAFVPARREIWYTRRRHRLLRRARRRGRSGRAPRRPAAAGLGAHAAASRGAPIGRRGIGRVRLGMTRKALARRLPAPRRKTKRAWRWCVKGGKGTRRRGVLEVRPRGARRARAGRARTPRAQLRRRYPHRRALGGSLVRAGAHSSRIFGVRGGKVRYVAVAAPRTIARRTLLRGYLRLALRRITLR